MTAVKPTAEDYEKVFDTFLPRDSLLCSWAVVTNYIRESAASLASHRQPESETMESKEFEHLARVVENGHSLGFSERPMIARALRAYTKLLRGREGINRKPKNVDPIYVPEMLVGDEWCPMLDITSVSKNSAIERLAARKKESPGFEYRLRAYAPISMRDKP